MKREKNFYMNRGITCPKDMLTNNEPLGTNKPTESDVNDTDFHRFDEQVNNFLWILANNPFLLVVNLESHFLHVVSIFPLGEHMPRVWSKTTITVRKEIS